MNEAGTRHGGRPQPGDFVFDGDPVPFPQKRAEPPPQFSANFYCGQTARCIKMPLGVDVGLSPGDLICIRWGPRSPSQKVGGALPKFSAHVYCG